MEDNLWFEAHKKKDRPLSTRIIIGIILGVLVMRFLLTFLPSYQVDMEGYRAWSLYLAAHGYDGFYQTFHVVYGPVFPYLLQLSGLLSESLSLSDSAHEYLIKVWAVVSDLVGAYFIYRLGRKSGKGRLGFFLGVAYALNPAVFFNSSIWGQFDSLSATMLMGTLYLFILRRKPIAVALFILAVLTKPQSIILLPLLIYLFFSLDFKWRDLYLSIIGGVFIYLLVILPFSYGRPIYWPAELYLKSGGDYPFASVNAFNFWTLLGGQTVYDTMEFMGLTYAAWSLILLAVICVTALFLLRRKPSQVFLWSFTAYFLAFGVFFFGCRMHERYLFPALIFLTTLVLWDRNFLSPLVVLSACHFTNQWYIYALAKKGIFWVAIFDPVAVVISSVTLIAMVHTIYYFIYLTGITSRDQVCLEKGVIL